MRLSQEIAVFVLFLGACGGARSSWDGAAYRDGKVAFEMPGVPAGWTQLSVAHASLAFRDEAHDASVLINARCGGKDDDTPLAALVNHLVMGTTERKVSLEETVPFDAREALHTRMAAKLDGVPRGFDLYVLKKDGCVYDFVYVAPPDRLEEGVTLFEAFVRRFHTTGMREGS